MRTLLMAGAAGLFLTIGAASADSQTVMFRPALDGIGNALPPAAEGASGIPDDVGFGPDDDQGSRPGRGRVIIDSATTLPANVHASHRRRTAIPP